MAIKFNQQPGNGRILHDRFEFFPGVALAFDDPDAEPYFTALGWAEITKDEPVRTYSQEEVSIDPLAVNAETKMPVLPERYEAALDQEAETINSEMEG